MPSILELDFHFPLVIAHRGDRVNAPENTLPAFEKGVAMGCPMMELDLTLSLDRQIVVIHDDTVNRTTNGRGAVQSLTLTELKALDAGFWFNDSYKENTIPTLEEVLLFFGGRILMNLEIKPEVYEPAAPDDRITVQVLEALKRHHLADQVMISSFSPQILEDLAELPHCPKLCLLIEQLDPTHLELAKRIGAYSINMPPDVTPDQARLIKKAGFHLFCYTVNEPTEMMQLWAMGVDGVFTDDPTKLLAHLNHLTELSHTNLA